VLLFQFGGIEVLFGCVSPSKLPPCGDRTGYMSDQ